MYKANPILATLLLLLSSYTSIGEADARHTDLLVPVLQMDPKSPIAGQQVTLTTVLTNSGNADMSSVQLSFSLDGVWIIDDVRVDAPALKSVRVSFTTLMPVTAGEHQLKVCPQRELLGDDGHHCQTLDFVSIDESTIVVAILSPKEEAVLRANATIRVATLGQNAGKVELYVQNELVDTKHQTPFVFTLDTTQYENGKYRIYAIAYYDSGVARASSIKKYFIDNSASVIVTVAPGHLLEVEVNVGQSVIIESDITNGQSLKIAATFIVLVKDSDGFTEFLSWEEKAIPVGQTFPMSQTWIPEEMDKYDVEVFLWDTIENSVPLSEVMKASINVS
ncbi:MAG: Ig-like domain-containing protein [Nitrososphaerales archaeon]